MFSLNRREFVKGTLGASAAAIGGFNFLSQLPPLTAAQVQVPRNMVRLSADIEPLVRLIEETPRDRLLEMMGQRIRQGASYQDILSALMLAGVRGIKPRPVGFKFHAVLVVNSAHLASLAAQDRDRWLPLFWSLDYFKSSQARNRVESNDWVMPPIPDAQIPSAVQAGARFREAMDNWDAEAADRAIAGWARTAGANEIYEAFWRYGARDFRAIGHKAIFVANSYRTLLTVGWRHAEPVLRSLAFALVDHEGTNPAQRDGEPDRPWRINLKRVARIRPDWQRGRISSEATRELLAALRTASPADAGEQVIAHLNRQVDPISMWDAIFVMAGELLMRQPGIIGLHTVTSINALYFAYQTTSNDETRRMMLLQASAFSCMFRARMMAGGLGNAQLDTLERAPIAADNVPATVAEIFADVSRDRTLAARKTLALLDANAANAGPLMAAGRRLIFSRGTDSHDYKYSSAALEDFYHLSPEWRNRFLASAMFNLKGSAGNDTQLFRRTQAALTA